jgi:hypothetical protein
MSEFARMVKFLAENFILYLRKSRADDPNETVEEVLSKHEARLQEFMERRYGFKIPEENIYREVCSAESIAEREKIKEVLLRIEDPNIMGVIVADVPRLSRGDLGDCNEIITRFRYTKTLVMTDTMTFDLEDKRDRQYFQDELLRGAYYLDYIKEVLRKGREGAVQNRGCFIGTKAPYGYNKIKIGKNHTLEPNKDADVVRLIFEWYVNEGLTYHQITCRLNEMCIPAPICEKWKKETVRHMLRNPHYDGKVTYGAKKETTFIENGEKVQKRISQDNFILAEGLHLAIVDHDIFEKAQEIRGKNPSVTEAYGLKNPFASILKCAKCGNTMAYHPYTHAENRLECRYKTKDCGKSIKMSEVEKAIIMALEQVELPNLYAKLNNDDGNAFKIKKSLLANLEKELQEYKVQEERQYEFLETGRYTEEVFDKRHTILRDKIEACQSKIRETQLSMPKEIDYKEKIVLLEKAINALKSDVSPAEKNAFLKAIVDRIEIETWGTNKRNDVQFNLDIYLRL